jgi:hypothetical protein
VLRGQREQTPPRPIEDDSLIAGYDLAEPEDNADVRLSLLCMAGDGYFLRPEERIEEDFVLRGGSRRRPARLRPQANVPREEVFGAEAEVVGKAIGKRQLASRLEVCEPEAAYDKRLKFFLWRFQGEKKTPLVHVDIRTGKGQPLIGRNYVLVQVSRLVVEHKFSLKLRKDRVIGLNSIVPTAFDGQVIYGSCVYVDDASEARSTEGRYLELMLRASTRYSYNGEQKDKKQYSAASHVFSLSVLQPELHLKVASDTLLAPRNTEQHDKPLANLDV